VYGGGSSSVYASFTAPTAIEFPGLAASSGHNCLQIDNSGYITNTGVACGSGNGNGTVSSASAGQIAYYTTSGTSIAGMNTVPLASGGTGASTAIAALANMGGAALSGATFTGPVAAPSLAGSINTVINVMAAPYNASCNLTQYASGSMSAGSAVLTGAGFTSSLVGQEVVVWNAGTTASNGSIGPFVTTVAQPLVAAHSRSVRWTAQPYRRLTMLLLRQMQLCCFQLTQVNPASAAST
jgi:hypothetical protein